MIFWDICFLYNKECLNLEVTWRHRSLSLHLRNDLVGVVKLLCNKSGPVFLELAVDIDKAY